MELYSYHVFLFPFQWQFANKEMHDKTLEERTCLKELIALFDGTKWKRKEYKLDTVLNYNEYNYYYSMVREVLFDEGEDLRHAIIGNLSYDIAPDTYSYNFKVYPDGFKKPYRSYSLHIDSILLHLYSTGVGVLSFHLNNRLKEQSDPDDILNINQAGRRLYPPFFGMDSNLVGTQAQFEFNDFSSGLDIVQHNELAVEFSVISNLQSDDFSQYRNPENFKANPFQIPRHVSFLFQGIPLTVDKEDFKGKDRKVYINPLIDDRMFVVCWYGNDDKSNELQKEEIDTINHVKALNYEHNDWWYKFMFNDQKNITCKNEEMKKDLIKKHTYTRWSGYGTFYGVNRYSFVCLTSRLDTLKNNNVSFIVNHMQTMYYKMAELCLVQRACLLRFSDEVAGISTMKEHKKISLTKRVGNLNQQYLRFVNKIYFREVTAQEQGIELYDMMQKYMKIGNNVKELDQEIKELHSYVSLMEDQKQSRNIELLTIIGALFILPTFIINFLGLIVMPEFKPQGYHLYLWQFLPALLLLIGPIIYFMIDPKRAKKWMVWLILFTVGVIAVAFAFALIINYLK